MRRSANYNRVALFYDGLCQFVFGQKIKNAQIESLQFIPPDSTILIVGGGTGWILDEITRIYSSGLKITYIDSSSKMIELSKKRNFAFNVIKFIETPVENTKLLPEEYDIIMTPFLFDNLWQTTALSTFTKLDNSLKASGYWLYTDFYLSTESKYRHIILLKLMYLFFRLTCKIEANKLPSIIPYFSLYKIISEKKYENNFITAKIFQKK